MNFAHLNFALPSTVTVGSFTLKPKHIIFIILLLAVSLGVEQCGDLSAPTDF